MSEAAVRTSIDLGHAARKAGRLTDALDHYRAALASEPDSAEANSVFGLMLLNLGRVEESEAPLRKAVAIAPGHAAYRMNLAQLLIQQTRLVEALPLLEGVLADEPQSWWVSEKLGDLQVRLRNFAAAEAHFGRAAGLKPNDPSLLFRWARSSFDSGQVDAAERILRDAAKLAPDHEAIYRLGSEIFEAKGKWATLERLSGAWTKSQPKSAEAWRWLANAQWETGNLRQGMQSYRASFDLGRRDADGLAAFARLCLSALDFDSATKALDEAEALDPENGNVLSAQAVRLMLSGRHEEAQAYCRRSLNVNKGDVLAYKTLTHLMNGRLPAEDLEALRSLAGRQDIRLQDRIVASYALADCLDASDQVDQAFETYERANRLMGEQLEKEGIRYDRAARTRQIDELISLFGSVPAGTGEVSRRTPVFIVGMPRSGTTLVESVIGAHSRAFACGERPEARWIMQECLALARGTGVDGIPEATWNQWREYYWKETPDLKGATFVTDKNPWNFDAVGMILRLFPDARIIHVRRNPVETGLSIFRNEFSKLVSFAHRLEDIGHYYGEYARMMAHWERVARDRFTTVQYEEFIGEFDSAGPALLAACGLDWEESCRDFWKQSRVISTMSTMQARKPPELRASRAQAYARYLQPLTSKLEATGVDIGSGTLR